MVQRPRVLLVEDEPSIAEPLLAALGREGLEAVHAGTVADAIASARDAAPDIVLLDVMLPDGSGMDVLRALRQTSAVPVIMVTARGDETDRVVGLELGADDYVVKPFSARELIARVRAVLRRTAPPPAADPAAPARIVIGDVALDPAARTVDVGGRPVDLSRKEYELLHLLMRNAGSVVTREKVLEEVWETRWVGTTKTLDVHVSSLRKKLGDDPADPRCIVTVRGVGLRYRVP